MIGYLSELVGWRLSLTALGVLILINVSLRVDQHLPSYARSRLEPDQTLFVYFASRGIGGNAMVIKRNSTIAWLARIVAQHPPAYLSF